MDAKHTPGLQFADKGRCVAIIPALRTGDVCTFEQAPSDADARLIAAAPELLALAESFRRTVEFYIKMDDRKGDDEGASLKRNTLMLIDGILSKAGVSS